jgi:hypothetical protein
VPVPHAPLRGVEMEYAAAVTLVQAYREIIRPERGG